MKFDIQEIIESTKTKGLETFSRIKSTVNEKIKGTVFEETAFDLRHLKTILVISIVAFFVFLYAQIFT